MDKRTLIQDEVVNSLPLKPHGLLNFTMRFGKSRVLCEIIKKNKAKKVLWVTVNTKLRDEEIPKEIEKWLLEVKTVETIDIICYQSLSKITGDYDLIILDEYQHLTESNSVNLFNKNLTYDYILGVTGTPPKHFHKRVLLGKLLLVELDGMSIDEAVRSDIVADYKITTVPVELNTIDLTAMAGSKDRPFLTTEAKNYQFWDGKIKKLEEQGEPTNFLRIKRANIVYNSISKLETAKSYLRTLQGRTMVFSSSIAQAEAINPHTYHSKTTDENYEKFKSGEIDILSCVNKGGIGETFEGVDNFLIVQCNSNKMGDITQKIGRSLLKQGKDYRAEIHIMYLQGTVDEEWKDKVLMDFDHKKITNL